MDHTGDGAGDRAGDEARLAALCLAAEAREPAAVRAAGWVRAGSEPGTAMFQAGAVEIPPLRAPDGTYRCPQLRCARRADRAETCAVFRESMVATPWELAVVMGPAGTARDRAVERCLRDAPPQVFTAGEADRPLRPYPPYPPGADRSAVVIAALDEDFEGGYDAAERLLARGSRVLIVTRFRLPGLRARFRRQALHVLRTLPTELPDRPIGGDDGWERRPPTTVPGTPSTGPGTPTTVPGTPSTGPGTPTTGPADGSSRPPIFYQPAEGGGAGQPIPEPAEGGWPGQSGPFGDIFADPDLTFGRLPRAAERVASIAVADGAGRAVRGGVPVGLPYLVRVGIGQRRDDSILSPGSPAFPERLLPASEGGWWLQAVLSRDGDPVDSGPLFLPRTGDGFACSCTPDGPHLCTAADRWPWLGLSMPAPRLAGTQKLQLALYLGAAAVQAFEIDVPVGGDVPPTAAVVFTLSKDLAELNRFGGRAVSIRLGDLPADRHYLIVNDAAGARVGSSISDAQAGTAARSLRAVLFDRQLRKADGGWTSLYDDRFGKPRDAYLADLWVMARAGASAFLGLFPRIEDRDALAAALATGDGPGVIQVALAQGSRAVIPWQLVYDLPILDGAAICPSVFEFGPGAAGPGAAGTSSTSTSTGTGNTGVAGSGTMAPARCPHSAGHDQPQGTLCPFGFWGLGHVLEVPPSSGEMTLAEATGTDRPPAVVVGLNETLRGKDWDGQRAALDRLGTASVVTTVPELRRALVAGADLLYLFCHGRRVAGAGSATGGLALDFGPGGTLTPEDVSYWAALSPRIRWVRRRPLVVLNGCHTGERLPETLTDFAVAFVQSTGAAGVLATEVTMEQRLAAHSMSEFVTAWSAGVGVGEALRRVRWHLLSRGNVMGLAYSPYCDADLRLP